ncbi:hypothetical protein IDSA_03775 [Pseudidiomarina salinarum]|uniref:Uncharacterized protein n=1 Tax=Pseudidiomarina salinarum TaxID=435908 RepID=A0A094IVW4_9GAMM|nr:hypothetical protein [Pseudidiomarina salinarum]KFZ31815.1 hypothetical protein IDSA_03775 [Pseudidiomarina salinarum]RUO70413.1 hypothetical protein CWI79_02810 [Pseudidiomarina salinarum]
MSDKEKVVLAAGDFSKALRGEIKLPVGEVLQRSWEITLRALPIMLAGLILLILVNAVATAILENWFPVDETDPEPFNVVISYFISIVVVAPFSGILIYLGILNAGDIKPGFADFGRALSRAPQVILTTLYPAVLMGIVVVLALLLGAISPALSMAVIVAVGIYIQLSFILAVPLVLDRNMVPHRACLASILIINKQMLPVFAVYMILLLIVIISMLPLFLGLIFTLPMTFNVTGVIYNTLIGVQQDRLTAAGNDADDDV